MGWMEQDENFRLRNDPISKENPNQWNAFINEKQWIHVMNKSTLEYDERKKLYEYRNAHIKSDPENSFRLENLIN